MVAGPMARSEAAQRQLRQSRRHQLPRRATAWTRTSLLGLAALWVWPRWPTALLSPLAAEAVAPSNSTEPPVSKCQELRAQMLAKVHPRISQWEKAAAEGQTIGNFGYQASQLVNQTLASFDQDVKQSLGADATCTPEREALATDMQQQLHSVFLVQCSTIEEALYQRLKTELLKRMRRKKRELSGKDRLKLLHACMAEYDSQIRDLQPFFVQSSEHDHAERRLGELQGAIHETPEAKEMQQRWKMERRRRTQTRQPREWSMSLSAGFKLMFRPSGLGNFQMHSHRQVGPPNNPNEIAIGVLNDGDVMDVYNHKPKPPLIKFQPTIGIDISGG